MPRVLQQVFNSNPAEYLCIQLMDDYSFNRRNECRRSSGCQTCAAYRSISSLTALRICAGIRTEVDATCAVPRSCFRYEHQHNLPKAGTHETPMLPMVDCLTFEGYARQQRLAPQCRRLPDALALSISGWPVDCTMGARH